MVVVRMMKLIASIGNVTITYTRCDGFWNCFDGADEIDCPSSSSLSQWICPSHSHRCILIETSQLGCLPIERADDGHIDCAGGTDEPRWCRSKTLVRADESFFCKHNNNYLECRRLEKICLFQ